MGTINIYKGLSSEYEIIKGTGTIKALVKAHAPKVPIDSCIFLNAGETVNADYEVKENDLVLIRYKLGVTGCAIIGLVCAAVAVGMSIYGAVQQQKAQEQAEQAQKDAKAAGESVKQLPFLKGAKNRSALGYNIPFIMGSIRHTPYTLTNGFYSIEGNGGSKQYWSAILVVGYANALINNVSIGTQRIVGYNQVVEVSKLDGSTEKVYFMRESEEPYMFHSGSYYDTNNKIEIRSLDEMTLPGLDCKISGTEYGDEIPHKFDDQTEYKNGVIKQLAANTYKVEVGIMFNGLRKYDKKWKSKQVIIEFYYCNNMDVVSPSWKYMGSIDTGEVNADRTLRYSITKTFSASECFNKDISIKAVRVTKKEESNSQEDCYLSYINCYQYDAWKSSASQTVPCKPIEEPWRDRTLRLGLRVLANDSTKDTLDEINCMVYGTARIWDGTKWTAEKYPTRNPASWILEIMTSEIHGHSRFSDSEIDLDSLGEVFEYCEEQQFHTDGIITEDIKKSDLINRILLEINATMYLDPFGLWTFAIERPQTLPVALLNEQSIKNITVKKDFERKPYAQKITYTDRTNWSMNTVYVSEDGKNNSKEIYNKEKVITENAVNYITEYNHAYKYAKRCIARQKLQPREITVQVGHEGDYYPLYSMILLQTKHLKIGLSSGIIHEIRSQNGKLTHILTSDICDFSDTEKRYGIILQCANNTGRKTIYAEVQGNGKTRVLELKNPIACEILPEYGNIYSFGYLTDTGDFESITNKMLIVAVKPNATGWELTLKDYSDDLFSIGTIPEYVPNLTDAKEIGTKLPTVTFGDVQSAVGDAMEILQEQEGFPPAPLTSIKAIAEENGISFSGENDAYNLSNSIKNIKFELSKDNGETWQTVSEDGLTAFYTFDRQTDGYPETSDLITWKVRAKAVNIYGLESENYITDVVDLSAYKTWIPSVPKVTCNTSKRIATLIIEPSNDTYGHTHYKILINQPDNDGSIFHTPGINLNPYDSELNYKDDSANDVFVQSTFKQGLPLKGQNKTVWSLNEYRYLQGNESEHYGAKRTYTQTNTAPNTATVTDGVYSWSVTNGTETTVYTSQEISAPNPESTIYMYKVIPYNMESGKTNTEQTIQAIAEASSVSDITDKAITQGKLDDQAVTAEKLAVGSITAEKIAVGNILSKGVTAGAMTTDGLTVTESGFWASNEMSYTYTDPTTEAQSSYGASKGEFFVGNTPVVYADSNETTAAQNAEYLHYIPGEGFFMRIKNFVIKGLQTIITGVFKVRGGTDNKDLLIVNATNSTDSDSSVAARTVKIDGNLITTGSISGTASVANKLGTATKGNANKPIYLNAGTATECNELCNLTGSQTISGAKTFSGIETFTGSVLINGSILKIPTTAPKSPQDGYIWLA